MKRDYVESMISEKLVKYEAYMTGKEVESLIDSILFDWNELGDAEADFDSIVDWNVEQFLSHSGNDKECKRIDMDEVKNFIPYPKDWFNISYKPKPKYFLMRKLPSGWDEVYYYLDAKINQKKYSIKLLE